MKSEDITKILTLILGGKTTSGGVRNTEVYKAPADPLLATQSRYDFYRDYYRRLSRISFLLGLMMIGAVFSCCAIVFNAVPIDRFFIASVDGRVQMITPLDTPTVSDEDIFANVAESIASSLTFGYNDFTARRAQLSLILRSSIVNDLQKILIGNADAATLAASQVAYIAKFDATRPAGIIARGVDPQTRIFQWQIQVPISITKTKGNTTPTTDLISVRVLVERAKSLAVRNGFEIVAVLGSQVDTPAATTTPAANSQEGR